MVLVFVDGVGLSAAVPGNPLLDHPTPALDALLGGSLTLERRTRGDRVVLLGIDANLGVAGLPQSATGQTTLFTGINAAEFMGRHVAAFPGPRLRGLIEGSGLLKRVRAKGRRVTFANAFSSGYFEQIEKRRRRPSVTVIATWSAELELRTLDDLANRRALSWDLERDYIALAMEREVPRIEAHQAGADLARLSAEHELTVFETFLPDLAGHRRFSIDAADVVRRLDDLLGGLLEELPAHVTLVLTSDHGNFEELEHKRHTRNLVPLLAVGPRARLFREAESLADVTPLILAALAECP